LHIKRTYKRFIAALFSKNKSAYFGLLNILLTPIGRTFDRIFPKKNNSKKARTVICILSAPRSGSTVLYQSLGSIIPSLYISNLHDLLPSRATSVLRRNKKFGKDLLKYRNYYGYSFGWNGVSEGNRFFDKIFESENTDSIKLLFETFLSKMDFKENEILFFKNIKHVDNIEKLIRAYPDLKIIRLRRDKMATAQSILKAYYELNYFNPIPDALSSVNYHENPHEFAIDQLLCLEARMDEICANVNKGNIAYVDYETFCKDPISETNKIVNSLNLKDVLISEKEISLGISKNKKVSEEDLNLLKNYLTQKQ